MDLTVSIKIGLPLRRFLPYWAVLKNDLGQTLGGGLFRACFLVVLALSTGLLVHRAAIYKEAGRLVHASTFAAEILTLFVLVGSTVVIVLSAGAIAGEREVLADSILCRGVSRWQYYLGKLHARLFGIIGGMLLICLMVVAAGLILLKPDVTPIGLALAFGLVASILSVVVSLGVALSARVNSSVLGIAILWIIVYGVGTALFYFEVGTFRFQEMLRALPEIVEGQTEVWVQVRLIAGFSLAAACIALLGGMAFSRRDL